MRHRHLDYEPDASVTEMGAAAIDDLLDRGDASEWKPLLMAVRSDPRGPVADTVLRLCKAHPMYGTSVLWRTWIEGLRGTTHEEPRLTLSEERRRRGLTQQDVAQRMGISQSDVSKLERRDDVRLSTLRAYAAAIGAKLEISLE